MDDQSALGCTTGLREFSQAGIHTGRKRDVLSYMLAHRRINYTHLLSVCTHYILGTRNGADAGHHQRLRAVAEVRGTLTGTAGASLRSHPREVPGTEPGDPPPSRTLRVRRQGAGCGRANGLGTRARRGKAGRQGADVLEEGPLAEE